MTDSCQLAWCFSTALESLAERKGNSDSERQKLHGLSHGGLWLSVFMDVRKGDHEKRGSALDEGAEVSLTCMASR